MYYLSYLSVFCGIAGEFGLPLGDCDRGLLLCLLEEEEEDPPKLYKFAISGNGLVDVSWTDEERCCLVEDRTLLPVPLPPPLDNDDNDDDDDDDTLLEVDGVDAVPPPAEVVLGRLGISLDRTRDTVEDVEEVVADVDEFVVVVVEEDGPLVEENELFFDLSIGGGRSFFPSDIEDCFLIGLISSRVTSTLSTEKFWDLDILSLKMRDDLFFLLSSIFFSSKRW
jgi:hypothetical protein